MHCPNCGTLAGNEQKFCRTCGFGLGKFLELFAEQQSLQPEPAPVSREERWVGIGINSLLGLLGASALATIVYFSILKGALWTGVSIIAFLSCIVSLLYLISRWSDLQTAKAQRRITPSSTTTPKTLPAAEDTAKLLVEARPPLSITERTTELLELPARRKPSSDLGA